VKSPTAAANREVTGHKPHSMIARSVWAFRLTYLLLARVLSWLALLARSDAARTQRSWCSVTRSPCCADTTHARRGPGSTAPSSARSAGCCPRVCAGCGSSRPHRHHRTRHLNKQWASGPSFVSVVTDSHLSVNNVRRRDRLGGLLHEYRQVASGAPTFGHPHSRPGRRWGVFADEPFGVP
jgi:hypothetical protein